MAHQWIPGPPTAAEEADRRLFFKVRNTLWDYEPLRASGAQLSIELHQGVVHVTGRVRSSSQKMLITALLQQMSGVHGVENLVVADPEVAQNVALKLATDAELAPYTLFVDSQLGSVTLDGELPSAGLADRAVSLASSLGIVLDVRSHIAVNAAASN